jgi:hypothetical protein
VSLLRSPARRYRPIRTPHVALTPCRPFVAPRTCEYATAAARAGLRRTQLRPPPGRRRGGAPRGRRSPGRTGHARQAPSRGWTDAGVDAAWSSSSTPNRTAPSWVARTPPRWSLAHRRYAPGEERAGSPPAAAARQSRAPLNSSRPPQASGAVLLCVMRLTWPVQDCGS